MIQSLDKSLGDCEIVRHGRASKGYLAKNRWWYFNGRIKQGIKHEILF